MRIYFFRVDVVMIRMADLFERDRYATRWCRVAFGTLFLPDSKTLFFKDAVQQQESNLV
jgi:hypothetical protein